MSDLIDPHIRFLRAAGRATDTIEDRGLILRRLDRELPKGLEKANTDELTDWLGTEGWSPKTRETYWYHLADFFKWAVRKGRGQRLDFNPAEDIPRPRVPRGLPHPATDDQVQRALAELRRPALRAIILAVGAGLRAGEIATAQREHVTQQRIRITGKGGKIRYVPLTADVWAELCDAPPGPLVPDRNGNTRDGHWLSLIANQALARRAITATLHDFRHSYATRLRRAGVDTLAISKLLGHSSVGTTQIYVQVDDLDLEQAVALLPSLYGEHRPVCSWPVPTAASSRSAA
jgi:integrase